jgi:hypothetical protein
MEEQEASCPDGRRRPRPDPSAVDVGVGSWDSGNVVKSRHDGSSSFSIQSNPIQPLPVCLLRQWSRRSSSSSLLRQWSRRSSSSRDGPTCKKKYSIEYLLFLAKIYIYIYIVYTLKYYKKYKIILFYSYFI